MYATTVPSKERLTEVSPTQVLQSSHTLFHDVPRALTEACEMGDPFRPEYFPDSYFYTLSSCGLYISHYLLWNKLL